MGKMGILDTECREIRQWNPSGLTQLPYMTVRIAVALILVVSKVSSLPILHVFLL
jgi:hypothetical protein